MILMWFGILLLAYWSFMKTLDSLRQWLMPLLQPLQKKEDSKFFLYFLKSLLMALLSFSQQFTGALTWHSVAQGHPFYRGKLVQICLASLGGILTLGLLLPWTVIPGAFLIALGFGAVAFRGQKGFARFFLVSFFWGVFLFAMESLLRNGIFLVNDSSYQDLIFLLADNRLLSVIMWMVCSLLLTVILRLEYWSWIFCLAAVSLGIMGTSVLWGFILGESLGWALLHYLFYRRLALGPLVLQLFAVKLLAAGIFLWIWGELKAFFMFSVNLGIGDLSGKILLFQSGVLAWIFLVTVISMIWGHWRAALPSPKAEGNVIPVVPGEWMSPFKF